MNDAQRLTVIKLNNEDRLAGKLAGSRAPSDEDVKFLLDMVARLDTPKEYSIVPNSLWTLDLADWAVEDELLWTTSLERLKAQVKALPEDEREKVSIFSRYSASDMFEWEKVV